MNVLLVEPCYENFGGYFRGNGIATALAKRKIHVDMLLPSRSKFFLGVRRKRINSYYTQYELPRVYINFFINGRILRGLIAGLFILFKRYDIIHLFALVQFESNIPLILFGPFLRHKIVVDWDDYWTEINKTIPFYNNYGGVIIKYFRFCEFTVQKLAKYGTATSDFLVNRFNRIGVANTFKIINGVNKGELALMSRQSARKRLGIPQNQKMLLTFGNTFFKERTIYLLNYLEKLLKKDRSIQLYMNTDPKVLIAENASDRKFDESIFNNIHSVGFLDKKGLALYLSATDAVVFMMGSSSYEKACFPIRVGTFLNGEKPIIINDTNTEACRTLKLYDAAVTERSLGALVGKTVSLLNDKRTRNKIANNVKLAQQDLLWEKQVDHLITFYKKIHS